MMGSTPAVSGIVPAHNAALTLPECFAALAASAGSDAEILVVDDTSTDGTAATAAHAGARVLSLPQRLGPAGARNAGARAAQGDLLVFVDADVVVAPGAVPRALETLASDPSLAAIFGSYDDRPRTPGLVSQYRNLLHHFVHQTGRPEASTFWAGCGVVRRAAFEAVGGFDADRFPNASIEDIDLGYRLRRAGYRIRLDRQMLGTHLKGWTFWQMVRTDIFHRAIPWARLILASGVAPDDLNLARAQRASVALTVAAALLLPASFLHGWTLVPALAAVFAVAVLNRGLFAFFRRRHGIPFALACVPLHLVFYLCGALGFVCAWLTNPWCSAAAPAPIRSRPPPGNASRRSIG